MSAPQRTVGATARAMQACLCGESIAPKGIDPPESDGHRADRKGIPVYSGVMAYFPDALRAVARLSREGNDKHNPGEPLHWSRGKSADHKDCIARHLMDAGSVDPETGMLHDVALAWRALANLQVALESLEQEKSHVA